MNTSRWFARTPAARLVAVVLGIAGTLATLPASAAGQRTAEGTWEAGLAESDEGWIKFRVASPDGADEHRLGQMSGRLGAADRAELQRQGNANPAGAVRLTIDREAGDIVLEGRARRGHAAGVFTFTADPTFARRMAELGFPDVRERDVLAAALHGVGTEAVRQLRAAGYGDLDFADVMSAGIFGVDSTYIARMRALGFRALDLKRLVAFRIHGVTPEFVGAMKELGFELNEERALAFRIHGVTPEFVRDARALKLGDLDGDDLLAMRIHRVSSAFVDSMRAVGVPPEDLDEAVAFRIHGVTPALVRELRAAGFDDLDGDDLIAIRIHGLDRRRGGRR